MNVVIEMHGHVRDRHSEPLCQCARVTHDCSAFAFLRSLRWTECRSSVSRRRSQSHVCGAGYPRDSRIFEAMHRCTSPWLIGEGRRAPLVTVARLETAFVAATEIRQRDTLRTQGKTALYGNTECRFERVKRGASLRSRTRSSSGFVLRTWRQPNLRHARYGSVGGGASRNRVARRAIRLRLQRGMPAPIRPRVLPFIVGQSITE
jgi:hypothetical protein